jgi:hypothetical protein
VVEDAFAFAVVVVRRGAFVVDESLGVEDEGPTGSPSVIVKKVSASTPRALVSFTAYGPNGLVDVAR